MSECDTLTDISQEDVTSSRQTRFLARQPIFDKHRKAVAYELLFARPVPNACETRSRSYRLRLRAFRLTSYP